jgi:predicted transcriptional regulator
MKKKGYFKGIYVKKNSQRHLTLKALDHGSKRLSEYSNADFRNLEEVTRHGVIPSFRLMELKQAGLVTHPKRGVYTITKKGRDVLRNHVKK